MRYKSSILSSFSLFVVVFVVVFFFFVSVWLFLAPSTDQRHVVGRVAVAHG